MAIGTSRDQENRSAPPEVDPCKGKGGEICVVPGHGDLWSVGDNQVNTKVYSYRPSMFRDDAGTFFYDDGRKNGAETDVEWYESGWLSDSDKTGRFDKFSSNYPSTGGHLIKGDMDKNLFFDIGFYVAGFDSNKTAIPADISNWNGICVVIKYVASDEKMKLSMQLDLGDSINQKIGNVLPEVVLESSEVAQCFEWDQFKQPGADRIISGEEAAKNVARIIFHFESALETEVLFGFDILAIGTNRDE